MYLAEHVQKKLRERGTISASEAVIKEGDLYVAVNVINSSRRIVQIDKSLMTLLESTSTKKLLKG